MHTTRAWSLVILIATGLSASACRDILGDYKAGDGLLGSPCEIGTLEDCAEGYECDGRTCAKTCRNKLVAECGDGVFSCSSEGICSSPIGTGCDYDCAGDGYCADRNVKHDLVEPKYCTILCGPQGVATCPSGYDCDPNPTSEYSKYCLRK